ncbi:DUF7096 domain-containing protein [Natronosalvus halobius]|uniref:DUF7096 domain-containing protein n=1 Tax=Natronosalvus halobius TaxID=2953746 RepID=UPI0020A0EBDA|nr:hypothetical protein [Natronosalvus halobius]USZ70477.1 hypothetical protein NGM15_10165 [Natronosalvus halobius]
MTKASPALLALLLVCALPAVTLVAAAPGSSTGAEPQSTVLTTPHDSTGPFLELENTANRLTVPEESKRTYTSPTRDFGTAVASADDEVRADADHFAFEQAFDETTDSNERADLIDASRDRMETRVQALEERERQAVQAYANGTITEQEFTQMVLRNYNEANELERQYRDLYEYVDRVPGYRRSRINPTAGAIATHQSQARAVIAAASTADRSPMVTVETSAEGYRLSLVSGGQFYQEVTRLDLRDRNGESQFGSFSEAESHAAERYPWALDNANSYQFSATASPHLYLTEISHPHGELYSYIDGATEAVTREHQSLVVSRLPIEHQNTWERDTVAITLNRTPGDGPAEVRVTDLETGEPVEAIIRLDGVAVGETGDDGHLWLATPAGDYEIEVETADETVTIAPST